jgi:hypothetical protein
MKTRSLNSQRGISLWGLLFVGVVAAVVILIGAKVVPSVTEYFAIVKAVKQIAVDEDTPAGARAAFDRAADVGYIYTLAGKDLEIDNTKRGDKLAIKFAYDKEISLFGSVYLLIKYRGSSMEGYN